MRRRELLVGCASLALACPARAHAVKTIGFVSWFSSETADAAKQFRAGLAELGYLDGRDVTIQSHFTGGDRERTREVVRNLVRERIDILVVVATPAIAIAKQEAGSLPIVMAAVSDPIAAGFAQTLSRPGGNLTGRTMFGPELTGKRIAMLREIRPGLEVVGFLGSSRDVNTERFVRGTRTETDRSGLKLVVRLVDGPGQIEPGLLRAMRHDGIEAVIVQPIFAGNQAEIVASANEAELPVVADFAMFAEAGAVLTYGIDLDANMRRAAYFVDRIFRGANPADLPIEQPTETKLALNLASARRFGWTIPPSLIARADEVIE